MDDEKECKKDQCEVEKDKASKEWLLGLNRQQIKLMVHNESSRKRLMKALDQHGCELIEYYKIIEK